MTWGANDESQIGVGNKYEEWREKQKILKAEEEAKAEQERLEKERLEKEAAEKAAQDPQPEEQIDSKQNGE